MKLSRLLFAAGVAIFLGACASTNDDQPASAGSTAQDTPAKPDFGNLDANDDQQLSLAEAAAHVGVSRGFKRADENGDGMLSRDEFRRMPQS